ncbi:SSS family solute:Na+ symporter [Enterococcus sp. PF1-24]|uniref:sodium:solute symporter family protein n=1 Tax=unclassified Enterococcus TaxID=2608891 RepID=UPI00247567F3|nr:MULTISPECIES: sodium:solute symporter family protein [unclassified Enterococcus]MDH6364756.1 SSS family solute:Na+ symporter [Enterococcus sp. PFB1-1]MDH6401899.1 SSS family solute:Na+ symporter [Enterococcus sp. PF1-24]
MDANIIFLLMFVLFASVLVGAGLYSKRWVSDSSDFILAGREVSTIINIMGVSAIGFAGTTIALAPGFAVQLGLKGALGWGLIYSGFGIIVFGLLFSNFIRRCGAQTLPEYLEMRYGKTVRSVVAITSVIGMAGILANNIVSCANTITGYTGWNQTLVIGTLFFIIIAFTFISGLWAATITDFIQVSIGLVAIPVLLTMLFQRFGGLDVIASKWPGGDFINTGIGGAQIPNTALTYPSILNFIICFAAALVWGNNYYWMKIASCRSEKVAKKSFVIAGILLIVVFMIPLALVGLFAGAHFTNQFMIAGTGGTLIHTAAYGVIVKIFPPLLGSFFVIAAVAASISTASTSAIGASAVATRDIYQRLINPNATSEKTLKASKVIMILIGLLTWGMCQFPGGPTYLFAFANCWLVPPAILLGLGVIWPKFNETGALCGALAGMITMVSFTILGDILNIFNINQYVYLASLGFAVTLIVAVLANLFGKSRYYSQTAWERVPTTSNREEVELEELDLKLLEMINLDHKYMADLTDASGLDSNLTGFAIERLDRGGYILREGMTGSKFYTFMITEKGKEILPKLSERQAMLANKHLNELYFDLLMLVDRAPDKQAEFVKQNEIKSMYMAAISSHLTRQGYIIEKGLFKRRLEVTAKGKEVLEEFSH